MSWSEFFQRNLIWGSAPDPGIYRIGPIPRGKETITKTGYPLGHPASVLGPGSALRSLPSVALFSAQVSSSIAMPGAENQMNVCFF